jgi:hypothetical protein
MEIINKWDNESINDRILWDQILMQTMPQGRPVWGFSNDDSHSLSGNGHAWNVMLMSTLDESAVRVSMETGAFYGVSHIDRPHGINTDVNVAAVQTTTRADQYRGGPDTEDGNKSAADSLRMLSEYAPRINEIIVVEGADATITIDADVKNVLNEVGTDTLSIIWFSGAGTTGAFGNEIARGTTLDLSDVADDIVGNYVRAEIVGTYGVAYTQPFGIVDLGAVAEAIDSDELDSLSLLELTIAMQNAELRDAIVELEDDLSVTVNTVVAANAYAGFVTDANKIDVVGAAFSATGGSVTLNVRQAVPVGLFNTLRFDVNTAVHANISLSGVADLKVPVAITLPVPASMGAEFRVLHFEDCLKIYDVIVPEVNADGTFTFVVSNFSTFAFVNLVNPATGIADIATATPILFALIASSVVMWGFVIRRRKLNGKGNA